jgi:hypothetical protein
MFLDAWLFPPLPCDERIFHNLFDEQKDIGPEFVSRIQEKSLCSEVELGPFGP